MSDRPTSVRSRRGLLLATIGTVAWIAATALVLVLPGLPAWFTVVVVALAVVGLLGWFVGLGQNDADARQEWIVSQRPEFLLGDALTDPVTPVAAATRLPRRRRAPWPTILSVAGFVLISAFSVIHRMR